MNKKILVLAGPSGCGKSTFARYVLEKNSSFEFSVSATTRAIREGEIDKTDYHFLSIDEFQTKIDAGDFIEHEEVYPGIFYGSLKSEVKRIVDAGHSVIFDIDVLGALNIKKQFKDEAHIVLIRTENIETLKQRLIDRGTEDNETLQMRMDRFEKELSMADSFDEVVINYTGDIDSGKKRFDEIIYQHFK